MFFFFAAAFFASFACFFPSFDFANSYRNIDNGLNMLSSSNSCRLTTMVRACVVWLRW